MRNRILALAFVILTVFTGACASRDPGDPLRPGFNLFSKEQDIQLGREAAAQIRQQVDVVDNRTLQAYVDNVGTRLATAPAAGNFPYEFTLINDKSINAFALPGGPIFVNSGLIAAADNEAQLAGVLAHEIAHVALRHSTNQASKANVVQLPAMVASGVLGQGSLLAQLGQIGLGLGVNSILLSYSREAENEADALGARIMAQAGYNPLEMARFFEKLQAQGGSRAPQFLSSHPDPGNRMKSVQAEIRTLPQGRYNADTGQFARAQRLVGQLPAPRASKRLQEARPNASSHVPPRPPRPSGDLRPLESSRYSLTYPASWQAYSDNQSAMVTIAPREGLVKTSKGTIAVGYGAILNYYFPGTGKVDLKRGTQQLLGRLRSANTNMQVSGKQRRVQVDGHNGLITYLSNPSPYGGTETNVVLTVERPEGLFYMVFVAPSQDFEGVRPMFQSMLNSIQFKG